MHAVVDHNAQAVWGIGRDPQSAMADAKREIACKQQWNPSLQPGELDHALLPPEAPLHMDGETLYQFVHQPKNSQQADLFEL